MTFPNFLVDAVDSARLLNDGSLPEIIRLLRKHLGMDIAFIAEFSNGRREFRLVDSGDPQCPIRPGNSDPLESTYCQRVVDGRFPCLMPDVAKVPGSAEMPVTRVLNIGAYLGVPIRLADGTVYGTFCCFSHEPDPSLNQRDLGLLHVCADIAARQIDSERMRSQQRREKEERIRAALADGGMFPLYQPIYDLADRRVVGFEALSRFTHAPESSPDMVFNEAGAIGLGIELDARAIGLALNGLPHFGDDAFVSVNVTPETILSPGFQSIFHDFPPERIVLEITEHAAVKQYQDIQHALKSFRARGAQLAVDDAGAGYASFRHILQLAPDRIKLDTSITKDVDTDPARRALMAAFVRFSSDTGSKLIAEGVETAGELATLQELGVTKGQGHFLGYPMPLANAVELLHA